MHFNNDHDKPPNLVDTLAEQWDALAEFAGRLTREIAGMGRRGQRGFIKNVEILEAWIRAALLQMAGQIELPLRKRNVRRDRQVGGDAADSTAAPLGARRAGFRAILPDHYEQQMLTLKRPAFDISQFAGGSGLRRDQRTRYLARLEAIGAVLENPELYARRVKRKLVARGKRPPMKLLPVTHTSALSELKRVSPTSELGRIVWYNDSS